MSRTKRSRNNHNNNWKKPNNQSDGKSLTKKQKAFQFNKTLYENYEEEQERQKAITLLKSRETICPKCNFPIRDVPSAITDKKTGIPAHFECVMNEISKRERLDENDKIAYIGQGRFGVLHYENLRDVRKFTIKKIIDVENRDERADWRDEFANLYSQVQ